MGFWSTLLVALRFRASDGVTVSGPVHSHRIGAEVKRIHRVIVPGSILWRVASDRDAVYRVRVEAR